MRRLAALALAIACLILPAGRAATVRIRNDYGSVAVRSVMGAEKTEVRASAPLRSSRADDVRYSQERGVYGVECRPTDGTRIDLDVIVAHTAFLEVTTKSGAISLSGLIRDASLVTDTGGIRLSLPWRLANVRVLSLARPTQVELPAVDYAEFPYGARQGYWTLIDAPRGFGTSAANPKEPLRSVPDLDHGLPLRGWLYGNIRARGNALGRLALVDLPVEPGSWVKMPAQALDVLDAYPETRAKTDERTAPPAASVPALEERLPVFVSDVRMVNLTGPVHDGEGRPVPGLKAEDFEVLEDGISQKSAYAGSEELPFNLLLLLDLSTTTLRDRYALVDAARQFVGLARPEDRVAVYALADGFFQVISPLTADRKRIVQLIEGMPPLGGTSPLYDSIALAYAQEALPLSKERTVLVAITDSIDNALYAPAGGSRIPFDRLLRFVGGMPVLVYPILLPPPSRERPWAASDAVVAVVPEARRRMQQLADTSGGRLFTAGPTFSMEPVYPLVAEELCHVYTVAYYPRNQDFDGRWRRVLVRVKRPGVTFRTREGYYAR